MKDQKPQRQNVQDVTTTRARVDSSSSWGNEKMKDQKSQRQNVHDVTTTRA